MFRLGFAVQPSSLALWNCVTIVELPVEDLFPVSAIENGHGVQFANQLRTQRHRPLELLGPEVEASALLKLLLIIRCIR